MTEQTLSFMEICYSNSPHNHKKIKGIEDLEFIDLTNLKRRQGRINARYKFLISSIQEIGHEPRQYNKWGHELEDLLIKDVTNFKNICCSNLQLNSFTLDHFDEFSDQKLIWLYHCASSVLRLTKQAIERRNSDKKQKP